MEMRMRMEKEKVKIMKNSNVIIKKVYNINYLIINYIKRNLKENVNINNSYRSHINIKI
jgi:hypothetical protein